MPIAVFPKCFINAIVEQKTMSVEDWIGLSARFDIDGLEFYWPFVPWKDEKRLENLRTRVTAQGRAIPMMCASPNFTQTTAEARRREVDEMKQTIETSAFLGVQYCRVLSGQRRPEIGRKDGILLAANCIRELLPVAQEFGLTLILENHYKDAQWTYPEFAQKLDVFLELLDAVGNSPWFKVNFDPSNAIVAGEDPIRVLEAVKDRVATMHASDRFLKGGTLEDLWRLESNPTRGYADIVKHGVVGRGLNDYDRIFSILRSINFSGWISIEDGDDPVKGVDDIAESAVFLRKKMSQYGLV